MGEYFVYLNACATSKILEISIMKKDGKYSTEYGIILIYITYIINIIYNISLEILMAIKCLRL